MTRMRAEQGDDDWVAAMRAGDFARAWVIADRDMERLARSGRPKHEGPRHLQRIWRGEELRGSSVLVRCYHGLGDTIQFARFLPALAGIAAEVIVWCQPALIGMIARIPGVAKAMPLHDGTPAVSFEVDIEIMELPHALRAGRELMEMSTPYLALAKREDTDIPANRAAAIGLVWRVGAWDKRREIPPYLFRELARLDVQLFSLQRDVSSDEIAEAGATDISTPDIELLADRLQTLDLIISVDTMVAHLAAALARPTWIMLHADGDWRWPSADCHTYWYPQVRLFHQHEAGDWRGVVTDVSAALQAQLNRSAMTTARARLSQPFWAAGCLPQADRTDASADTRD
jgi:hypothetical protein